MGERCDNKSKIEVADAYRSLSVICGSFTQKVNYSFCLAVFTCDCFYSILIFTRLLLNPKSKCRCMMWKGIFTAHKGGGCIPACNGQESVWPGGCDQGMCDRRCVWPGGVHPRTHSPQYGQQAGGMHPIGMFSCLNIYSNQWIFFEISIVSVSFCSHNKKITWAVQSLFTLRTQQNPL